MPYLYMFDQFLLLQIVSRNRSCLAYIIAIQPYWRCFPHKSFKGLTKAPESNVFLRHLALILHEKIQSNYFGQSKRSETIQ